MHLLRLGWTLGAALLVVACAKQATSPSVNAAPTPSVSSAPTAAPAAEVKGLANPTSDPATVLLANNALACKWKPDCTGHGCPKDQLDLTPDEGCAGVKTWRSAKIAGTDAGDATLVNMLEDRDVRVRLLGAWQLSFGPHGAWASNRELARRVIAAAAAESEEGNQIAALAGAVADINYDATGLWPDAKAAVEAPSHSLMKSIVLNAIGKYNAASEVVWQWALANAKASNGSGASYLAHFHTARQADVCTVLGELLVEKPNTGFAAQELTAEGNGCPSSIEPALAATEAFLTKDFVRDWGWVSAADNTHKNRGASAQQKARAADALAAMARESRSQGVYRAEALRRLHRLDKAKASALAATLGQDKNAEVAGAVKEVLASK